ncbi:MAG: hypothetical protein PT119_03290 [Aphanizomenon gracile PMC627.10]|nr:hypothetical protein [Aphanizomenon gracile PMC627.10]
MLLILTISACSNKETQDIVSKTNNPDNELEFRIKDFLDHEGDIDQKVAYRELFGREKAIQEAKEYCNKLDQGKNKIAIINDLSDDLTKKVDENKITEKERKAIFSVYNTIHFIAQDIYCPQHREKEQIPLKERLK